MSKPLDKCKFPNAFWNAFREIGVSPSSILKQARLPVSLARDGKATMTTNQLFELWHAIYDLTKDSGIAIKILKSLDKTGHQSAFVAACYASNFRDAIMRIDRFKRLGSNERFLFSETPEQFTISKIWPYAMEDEPAISIDLSFAFAVELGRKGTGELLKPIRVEYKRAAAEDAALRDFFGCEIIYGAPENKLILQADDLKKPFPGHNLEFLELITPALSAMRNDLDGDLSFVEQVMNVLKNNLASGRPQVDAIARELGTSTRTLQRRILDEKTTFRMLLNDARKEMGEQLLLDPSLTIDEVAYLVGFQDTRSFYRAFHDWEGIAPKRWRALNGHA